MRKKEREITDSEEIERIVKRASICRIGLVDGEEAYIVPVCYGYEKNALYFHSAPEGRKAELIKKNNRVCFEIDIDTELIKTENGCGWDMKYRCVMGTGKAHILEGDREKIQGLKILMKQYSEDEFSFPKAKLDKVMVVRIDIGSMTGKQSGY